MTTAASADTPHRMPSHTRQLPVLNSGVQGLLNVMKAPNAEASAPITPLAYSRYGCAARTSANLAGNARLTRKMSENSRIIERHQITVTPAWNSQYAFCVLSLLMPGLNTTTTNSEESTVWVMIA